MIRPAIETDASAMADVMGGWVHETPWMPKLHSAAEDLRFCQSLIKRAEVWAADTAQGFGFLSRTGDRIDALYLAPAIRGAGWGAALLDAIKQDQDRLTLWAFQENQRAIAFYQRNGFHIAELTDGAGNEEKLPDCLMTWTRETP